MPQWPFNACARCHRASTIHLHIPVGGATVQAEGGGIGGGRQKGTRMWPTSKAQGRGTVGRGVGCIRSRRSSRFVRASSRASSRVNSTYRLSVSRAESKISCAQRHTILTAPIPKLVHVTCTHSSVLVPSAGGGARILQYSMRCTRRSQVSIVLCHWRSSRSTLARAHQHPVSGCQGRGAVEPRRIEGAEPRDNITRWRVGTPGRMPAAGTVLCSGEAPAVRPAHGSRFRSHPWRALWEARQ